MQSKPIDELVTALTADAAQLETIKDGANACASAAKSLMGSSSDWTTRAAQELRRANELVQKLEAEGLQRNELLQRAQNLAAQYFALEQDAAKLAKARAERLQSARNLAGE